MKCFNHEASEAVAPCKNCGEDPAGVRNPIPWVNNCEQKVRAFNHWVAAFFSNSTGQKFIKRGTWFCYR